MLHTIQEHLRNFIHVNKTIPVTYYIQNNNVVYPWYGNWEEIPVFTHVDVVLETFNLVPKDNVQQVGVMLEVSAVIPQGSNEDTQELQRKLERWKEIRGTYEGFPGIRDYGLAITYNGASYRCFLTNLKIEGEVKTITNEIIMETLPTQSPFIENLPKIWKRVISKTD